MYIILYVNSRFQFLIYYIVQGITLLLNRAFSTNCIIWKNSHEQNSFRFAFCFMSHILERHTIPHILYPFPIRLVYFKEPSLMFIRLVIRLIFLSDMDFSFWAELVLINTGMIRTVLIIIILLTSQWW